MNLAQLIAKAYDHQNRLDTLAAAVQFLATDPVNPTNLEGWHTLGPFGNGWSSNHGRYRLTAAGELEIDISLTSGSGSGTSLAWPNTLPPAYRPAFVRRIPGVPASGSICHTTVNTSGSVTSLVATGAATFDCCGRVPLD